MIVVSDTTPILSLLKAGRLELLEKLYRTVVVPEAVYSELTSNIAYKEEKEEIEKCPFICVEKIHNVESVRILRDVTGLDALKVLLAFDIRLSRKLCNKVLHYVGIEDYF